MKGYIYKITSPSGKIYIGQTYNLEKRLEQYRGGGSKFQRKLYRSFTKYGWNQHKFEIIEEIEYNKEELDNLEIKYILEFKCVEEGLNCRYGGSKGSPSEESKERSRQSNLGKKRSKEACENNRRAQTGKKMSEESKRKISEFNKGKKLSEEHKEKLRNKTFSEEYRKNISIGLINYHKNKKLKEQIENGIT